MAVNLIDNEQIHVIQNGSDITLDIQNDALKNEDVVVESIRSKNIFNKANILNNTYLNISNQSKLVYDSNSISGYAKCKPNTTYTISKIVSAPFIVATCSSTPAIDTTIQQGINNDSGSSITITTNSSAQYIVFWFYHTQYSTESYNDIINSIQVEEGSTATTYSPYFSPANEMSDKLSQIAFKTTDMKFEIKQYSNINLNNLADQLGVSFIYGTSLTNAPVGALGYIITICILDPAYAKQYFMAPWSGSPEIYTRTKDNGTWSSWYKINAVAL